MRKRLAWLALGPVAVVLSLTAACGPDAADVSSASDEEIAELADGVRVVDARFANDVEVTNESLILSKKGNEEAIAAVHRGDVLVGDRSKSKASNNPYGFARRVVSTSTKDGKFVIATERVALADLFSRAKFKLKIDEAIAKKRSSIRTRAVGDAADGEPPRLEGYGIDGLSYGYDTKIKTVGDQTADVKVTVSDGYAFIDPTGASISLEKEDIRVKKLTADLPIKYDAGFTVCGELSVQKTYDDAIGDKKLKKTLLDKDLFQVTVFVGGVPVVVTLHANVDVWCTVDISGKATISGKFRTRGGPTLHVGWDDGWTSDYDKGDPQNFGTVDAEAEASAALTCGTNGKMGVYIYDSVGLYATLNPSVTLKATGGAGTTGQIADRTSMCLGMDGQINSQVGVEAKVFSEQIFDRNTTPFQTQFEIFNECTNRDSCSGRPAGWFCSDLEPYSAFECDANQTIIRGGIPCDTTQLCKRTGPSRTDPAEMGPQPADPSIPPTPVCVSQQQAEVQARVLSCPIGQVPLEQHTESSKCEKGNGYACGADPVSKRDRACCNGQCVVYQESACDDSCRCYGQIDGVDVGTKKCGETVCDAGNVLWRCEGTTSAENRNHVDTSYVRTFEACPASCTCEGGVDQNGDQVGPKACGETMCGQDAKAWTCDAATKTWQPTGEACQ